jgi:hypothetical protein
LNVGGRKPKQAAGFQQRIIPAQNYLDTIFESTRAKGGKTHDFGRTQLPGRPATVRAGLVSEREMGRPSTKDREVGMTEPLLYPVRIFVQRLLLLGLIVFCCYSLSLFLSLALCLFLSVSFSLFLSLSLSPSLSLPLFVLFVSDRTAVRLRISLQWCSYPTTVSFTVIFHSTQAVLL